MRRLKDALIIGSVGCLAYSGVSIYTGNEKFFETFLMPAVHLFDAEKAHKLAVKCIRYKLFQKQRYSDPPILKSRVFNRDFSNPIGIAAGFDKQAEAVDGLLALGFGFVEIGTVTPDPQPGNAKPRVYRLDEDKAVINRYGFNSQGHEVIYNRLLKREKAKFDVDDDRSNYLNEERNTLNVNFSMGGWFEPFTNYKKEHGIVGVNLGKNRTSKNPVDDYVRGVSTFSSIADYLVINVSSPNTPGLREMQGRMQLQGLLEKVVAERNKLPKGKRPPILLKISPDLTRKDKEDIAVVATDSQTGIDGLIISNTTIRRDENLHSCHACETGGLSGEPLKELSTDCIHEMYYLTNGKVPIIGVGGVSTGQDAYDKIRAGASLVQIYTSLVFSGPPVVQKIKRELTELLERDGFESVSSAIGYEHSHPEAATA